MRFNSSLILLFLFIIIALCFNACGIDERSKRAKEIEKKQAMDSLFKDADKVPSIESESEDTLSVN